MAKRKRLGILFSDNENWIGGTYYIINLIAALNTLKDEEKPYIVVFVKNEKDFSYIRDIGYPYIEFQLQDIKTKQLPLAKRILNKVYRKTTGFDLYAQPLILTTCDVDVLFPSVLGLCNSKNLKQIFWIPDFQEKHHPNFFSKEVIEGRNQNHKILSRNNHTIIFSSNNALNDFNTFYPNRNKNKAVVNFAVTHPKLGAFDTLLLKQKYGITEDYYISPNQFWVHKNHILVINAAKYLHENNRLNFQIVFTGKEEDFRFPEYANSLKKIVKENGLEKKILFLGFIDRIDQLKLIKTSIGLIQPSLFEGWSTVIEDGKSLQCRILASDILVHREQLHNQAVYFDTMDAVGLAEKLILNDKIAKYRSSYQESISAFAKSFLNLL